MRPMRARVVYLSAHGEELLVGSADDARAPWLVVADFADESIVRLALPPVRGRARRQLLHRRLQQHFPDTPYRLALPLRATAGAEVTDVLIGVPAGVLDAVLQPLVGAGQPIRSVWTVTMLLAWWARLTGVLPDRGLFVIPTPAGIRHVLLARGKPLLTRLVPHELSAASSASRAGQELARTVKYLLNARLIPPGVALPAWSLGGEPPQGMDVEIPLAWQQAPRAAMGQPDVGARGLYALCELVARRAPPLQLAPPAVRIHHRARLLRSAAVAATTALVVVAGLGAADRWLDAALNAARVQSLDSEAAARQARLQAAEAVDPVAGVNAREALRRLRAYRESVGFAPNPGDALHAVARAFDAATPYALAEMTWQRRDTAGADREDDRCGSPKDEGANATLYLRGAVDGTLALREVARARERFEQALAGDATLRFSATQPPLDAEGRVAITGDGASRPREFAYCVWTGRDR